MRRFTLLAAMLVLVLTTATTAYARPRVIFVRTGVAGLGYQEKPIKLYGPPLSFTSCVYIVYKGKGTLTVELRKPNGELHEVLLEKKAGPLSEKKEKYAVPQAGVWKIRGKASTDDLKWYVIFEQVIVTR